MVEANRLPLDECTEDLYHSTPKGLQDSPLLSIHTYYESMWMERGLNIRFLSFRLPHSVKLAEPDVEIPLDEYRSYHRDKRSTKDMAK